MRKHMLLFLLILAISFGFAATYQIGDGTMTQSNVPFTGLWDYSTSKFIYTAAELAAAGLNSPEGLIAIGFDVSNSPTNYLMEEQYLFMRHTDLTEYDDAQMVSPDGFTLVYSGDILFDGGGWIYVTFDNPFPYDGSSGIEMVWQNIDGNYDTGYPNFRSHSISNMAAYKNQDGSFPEPPIAGTMSSTRPNIILASPQTTPPNAATLVAPADGGFVVAESVTLKWADGGGFPTGYKLYVGTSNPPAFVEDLGNVTTYELENIGEDVTYYWKVEPYSDIGVQTDVPVWSFDANPDDMVIVGDGTLVHRHPFGHLYGFERSAAVYPFEDIGAVGAIESIGWDCTVTGSVPVPYKIYMSIIEETETTQQLYDDMVEDMILVSEGEYTFAATGWHVFNLDTPFIYTGGNLLVAVETNYGGGGGSATERFTYTSGHTNQHIYWQLDNNPPTTTGYRNADRPNIVMQFSELTGDPQLAVSLESIDFGNAIYGHTMGPRNINLSNIGGGSITIAASDVSLVGSPQFSYDSSLFPLVIGSAEMIAIPVTITGTTEGPATATITISFGAEEFEVELNANVLPDGLIFIGEGTQNNYMPINTWYNYSYTQMLYKADEILTTKNQLEKVAFHWNGVYAAPNSSEWTIYIGHTDKEAFDSSSDWINIEELTEVFQGAINIPAEETWIEILLHLPFVYNREDNLVIAIRETEPGYDSSDCFFYNTPSTPGRSIRSQNDYVLLDPAAPSAGTLTAAYPNIRMYFDDVSEYPILGFTPESINFGEAIFGATVGPRNITIVNQGGGTLDLAVSDIEIIGDDAPMFSFDGDVFPVSLETAENVLVPVYVTGTIEGPISATLVISYDGLEHEVELSANVLPDGLIIIGDGTDNNNMPVNASYGYSYAQMLYMADEILIQGRQIEKVAYHWNGAGEGINSSQWTIFMGHTDIEAFDTDTDWIDIDNLTEVYQGFVDIPAENIWIEIELNLPFIYNGEDNLVIAVRESEPGYDSFGRFFYSTPSTTGRSIRTQNDNIIPDPAAPPIGTLTAAHPNIRLYFNDIPAEPVLAIVPNVDEWDFGLKPRFSETTKDFTIANNGAGILTVNNVTATGDGFALEEAFVSVELESTESVTITVVYNPEEAGDYEGLLTITSSHGSRDIDLLGSCYDPVITELPFFEGFEEGNTEGSADIAQWEQIAGTEFPTQSWTANSSMTTYAREPRTGDWNATLRYNGESTLVRPIMLEEGETYSLEFWARQDAASGATIQALLADNDQLTGDDVIDIVAATAVYSGDYQQFTGEFEVSESGLYYLGIYGHVTITPWYISLDDITVDYADDTEELIPPNNLQASVDGMNVQLSWNAPGDEGDDDDEPGEPQWITWCDTDTFGQNAIGTGGAVVFDVAHRFDANDLADFQGMDLTKMSFVPSEANCVYTAKVWAGTSAAAPSTLIHSQAVPAPTIGAWNEVIFTSPIPIPATGELWIGYEVDTQAGHPAGVDDGPPVAGKGNMMYFNNDWIQLTQAGATLTYNWSIQGFVDNPTPPAHARALTPIYEEPREIILGANFSALHNVISEPAELNSREAVRALNGYKVYRDNDLLATINDPTSLTYLDEVAVAGTYSYTVTAIYDGGESDPAGPVEVEVVEPTPPTFAITPTSHNYGEVGVGQTASQEFTVSNEGEGTLTINAITISGAMMSLDTLPTLPANLTAGQTLEFTAIYAPTAEGAHTGTITVTDNLTRVAHTVALSGTGVDVGDLYPPVNLQASVVGMDVTLTWDEPVTGDWITWCNPDEVGNAIGTGGDAVFDVAHRFDANDLSPYQGNAITKVGFVPNEANCTYTIKLWAGTSAAAPSTVIHSQVVNSPVIGDWNEVELTTPVGIPPTGELWVGYEANTQTGHPAGCDGGPPIAGKGNMMYFNNQWIQLTDAGATLTYNWLIMSYVD
ncbi:MAG: choice-of-anchor D domain-containing protein, partial [Candidatus Cloacimonadaceae bacterium]